MPDYPSLPKFEGRTPDTAAVAFTGGAEGQPPHIDAYRHQQPVAFLVIGEVGDVTHGEKGGEKDRRYVRSHKIVVEKVIRLLDVDEAARIYNNAVETLYAGADQEALDLEPALPEPPDPKADADAERDAEADAAADWESEREERESLADEREFDEDAEHG